MSSKVFLVINPQFSIQYFNVDFRLKDIKPLIYLFSHSRRAFFPTQMCPTMNFQLQLFSSFIAT